MLKNILIGVAALVLAFAGYVAMLPNTYRIERAETIAASPSAVFAEINDLKKWQAWSPWAKLDPNAKAEFEGPQSGPGAIFKWSGNDAVGEGAMAIVESVPDQRVKYRVDFVKPYAGMNHSELTLKPDGDKTAVTWATFGEHGFFGKAMCVFMNMDKMLGDQFQQGLANLKKITEAAPKV